MLSSVSESVLYIPYSILYALSMLLLGGAHQRRDGLLRAGVPGPGAGAHPVGHRQGGVRPEQGAARGPLGGAASSTRSSKTPLKLLRTASIAMAASSSSV